MARARSSGAHEGTQSTHVTDSNKIVCNRCGGVEFHVSSTLDEGDDITEDTTHAALYLTNAGNYDTLALVGQCVQCGVEQVLWFLMFDIASAAAGAAVTMTDMVQTSAANLAAGLYAIYLDAAGTDTGLYYTVASNTKADPTVLTMTVATNNDEAGFWCITNLAPTGWTAAS
jgi:hypothetical protein